MALKFTQIPYLNFAQAFSFIQANPSILVEKTTDSLLLEGFNAEMAGEKDRARRCVEKGLLVQYCRKLGKDGVRLFFQRSVSPSAPHFPERLRRILTFRLPSLMQDEPGRSGRSEGARLVHVGR